MARHTCTELDNRNKELEALPDEIPLVEAADKTEVTTENAADKICC